MNVKRAPKIISLLLALIMIMAMLPATVSAAEKTDTSSVTITAQASYGENGFFLFPQKLTVKAGLAKEYGYNVVDAQSPTAFDAMVAMHIQKYGNAFKEDPTHYLEIKSSMLRKAFGEGATSSGFYVNNQFPKDKDGVGYNVDSALLKTGDNMQFWIYTDSSGMCFDFYTYFNKKAITVEENRPFSLQLTGYMAVGEMYADMGWVDPKDTEPQPIYDEEGEAAVYTLKEDGTLKDKLGTLTEKDGVFKTSIAKAGNYKLTASGYHNEMEFYTLILPYCEVEVLPAGTIANVEKLIKGIGKVSAGSKNAINKARAAYNGLSAGGKKLVSNVKLLIQAETAYKSIVEAQAISKKTVKLKANSLSYKKAKITWNKVKGADGYQVYRATAKNGKYKKVKTTVKTSWINAGLTTGKTYYYKVRAYTKAEGNTFYSKTSAVKSVKVKPAAIKLNVKAGNNRAAISWKTVGGADKYQIYRAPTKAGRYIKVRETVKTTWTDRGLKSGKTYYYKARAFKKVSGKRVYGSFSSEKVKAK